MSQVDTSVQTYSAKLRTRKDLESQRDTEGYTDAWGWWADVCPGSTLKLRDATDADINRCNIREGGSRNPADWLCELGARGSLVSRKAVALLTPTQKG
jgi:hypothetical protein